MTGKTRGFIGMLALMSLGTGCGKAAAPFDQIKDGSVVAYRLQNYEPAATTTPTTTPTTPPAAGGVAIPGVPAEIQQWINQGAAGLKQLIPPGLVPPELLQGLGGGTATPTPAGTPAVDTTPRFPDTPPNFRILGQTQVVDPVLKKQLMKVFGKKSAFQLEHANCLYAEFGLRFGVPPAPANDVLVSFSCNQVAARGFAWPYPATGLKPETVKKLSAVINKLFPPGT
ncbi:MAG: hypothetical protein JW751_21275 [Polyangiaceae bacterium]|nr:hypothetical protein [Polyangiaceae bacterium]